MAEMPSGFLTFLFTDIEGSTRLWEERTEAMWDTLRQHDAVMRTAIENAGGFIFKTVGDAFCATFLSSEDALRSVIAAQHALVNDPLLNGEVRGFAVRVRMGLHCGEAMQTENDYFGPVVNRAARVAGVAQGGQVVLSAAVTRRVQDSLPPGVSLKDLGSVVLKGLDEPEPLTQILHPDLPADFAPLPTVASVRTNLPQPPTTFIGRSEERAAIRDLLRDKNRLVTILGPGGAGKTRLALQIAAELLETYPGGVWWADLTTLTDSEQVLPAIAAAFGLQETGGRSLIERIAEPLRSAPTLLVLDNFEQVTDAAPQLDTLLRLCPSLSLLVTSRSMLNLSLERVFPLSEMTLEEATELFIQRIRQTRPQFSLDEGNRVSIERIIRRLDFNPLALELAAAQARLLSVAQIEKQLSQRFRLLVSPYRDVSQRQKTLRGALDWSYDILSEEDRQLFLRLAAFAAPFKLEDALAVCDGEDVIAGLMRLRDQSLLRMEDRDDFSFFRMQESLREYGLEKASTSGGNTEFAGRIARYFADLAETSDYADLLFHRDNLRAALEWLLANRETETAARLCLALITLWERQGAFREAYSALVRTAEALSETEAKAQVLRRAGGFALRRQDYGEAESLLLRSQEIFRALALPYEVAKAQNERALIARAENRYDEARALFLESLAFAEQQRDEPRMAARLSNLGLLEIAEKRFPEAREHLERALAIYERRGDTAGTAICLCNRSDLALASGEWEEAAVFARRSAAKSRSIDDADGVLYALVNLAQATSLLSKENETKEAAREGMKYAPETEQPALIRTFLLALLPFVNTPSEIATVVAAVERAQTLQAISSGEGTVEIVEPLRQRFQETALRYERDEAERLQTARQDFERATWEDIRARIFKVIMT